MPTVIAIRLLALAGLMIGVTTLLANVAQSYDTFVPSYAGFYFQQQLARPVIGIALSLTVAFFSGPLARLLARGSGK